MNEVFVIKQKTAYEMRISDLSSDVCSSDLNSTQNTSGMKRAPRKKMTNTAGPAPASCFLRSRPQALQRSAIFRMPENSRPLPQRGQRQARPARIALGGSGGRTAAGEVGRAHV